MNEKIKIYGGKVFVYNEDEKCFQETTDPTLIGLAILDIAENECELNGSDLYGKVCKVG